MGIENMRRWPLYVIFAVSVLLALQLFSSWGLESDLRYRIGELSSQLQDCSKQHTGCMEESLSLQERSEGYKNMLKDMEQVRSKLNDEIKETKNKAAKSESQANRTLVDVELCKAELQSLKNLELSKTAMLETLRLEKETLTSQLEERKQKIKDLEKEIEKLKSALTTKSVPNVMSSKVPPAAAPLPPKISPVVANIPINEPVLEDNAKEEIEETNFNEKNNNLNDDNDNFDPQMQ